MHELRPGQTQRSEPVAWAPITDLTDADRAARSEELPLLAEVWQGAAVAVG